GADDAKDRAIRRPADRQSSRQHVDVVAVLVTDAELALVGLLALCDAIELLTREHEVRGMEHPLPGIDGAFDLIVFVAEHLLPSRGVHDDAGFEVPVPDAFLRTGERERQAFFARTKSGLGAFAFREIEMRADEPHNRAVRLTPERKPA